MSATYPQKFIERMKERLGSEFPAFLQSYQMPPCKGLRVNTLKLSAEAFYKRSPFALEPIAWEENGFYLSAEKAGKDPFHAAGLYYLQEPSAMSAAKLLEVRPGERVLDLCAAPGGKTTQLAAALNGEGILIANEIDRVRARALAQNVERLGVKNCAVTNASPRQLCERFPEFFDKILVDAPCSGEGMFKKEPNAVLEWSEAAVLHCAERQREILDCAAEMVRGGGEIVYSTCTFAEEEDEWQIEKFLSRHPEFELCVQEKLFPHKIRGEGHFCAKLRKKDGAFCSAKPYQIRRSAAANSAFRAFSEEFFEEAQGGEISTLADGRMYAVPRGMPDLGNIRLLRLGVELGEWDGKLFLPAHALAMALGAGARRKVSLSREDSVKYLHGETLLTEQENGWCVVCVEEFPLGLGKTVNGTVKNHLPKGLRWMK